MSFPRSVSRCARCARRYAPIASSSLTSLTSQSSPSIRSSIARIRSFATSPSWRDAERSKAEAEGKEGKERDGEGEGGKRINTWFLDPSPAPSRPPRPQTSNQAGQAGQGQRQGSTAPHKPRFTTFDPLSTLPAVPSSSSSSSSTIAPLPLHTSSQLRRLHTYLMSEDTAEVLSRDSVRVFDTLELAEEMQARGEGEVVRPPFTPPDLPEEGRAREETIPVEGVWRWIVLAQVRGRGRGVVARADGVVRRWLVQNPLGERSPKSSLSNPKLPRIDPDADWSIVPLPHQGICINLLTEEGRERWRLEDMWAVRGS